MNDLSVKCIKECPLPYTPAHVVVFTLDGTPFFIAQGFEVYFNLIPYFFYLCFSSSQKDKRTILEETYHIYLYLVRRCEVRERRNLPALRERGSIKAIVDVSRSPSPAP